jgi:ABC-2 type transport system ATP-binding protein
MIKVENLVKHFKNVKAVDGISFTSSADKGIFGLLGPNGAGKSTTIKMLMNIIAPDSGVILFKDKPMSQADKNRIGYLPEERGLYPKFKVSEILHYFGSLKGADKETIEKNIDYWLDRFNLTDFKHSEISSLSKGMSQKVQFIVSIVHNPDLIFLDEPFAGFDPVSADLLRDSIIDLGKQGKNILFSTHIMEQAEKICSEIFIINKGKEVVSGNLKELKQKYGNNSIIIEFDGDGTFIETLPFVEGLIKYPRYMEITLKDNADPDKLLQSIVGKIRLSKFVIQSPSLHNIFVSIVGKTPKNVEQEEQNTNKMR